MFLSYHLGDHNLLSEQWEKDRNIEQKNTVKVLNYDLFDWVRVWQFLFGD